MIRVLGTFLARFFVDFQGGSVAKCITVHPLYPIGFLNILIILHSAVTNGPFIPKASNMLSFHGLCGKACYRTQLLQLSHVMEVIGFGHFAKRQKLLNCPSNV